MRTVGRDGVAGRTWDPVDQPLEPESTEVVGHAAGGIGGKVEPEESRYLRTVDLAALAREALTPVMGEEHVAVAEPSAGGDDFAYFAQSAPGCLFLVGSSNAAKGLDKGHHNSAFDIDEDALPIGAACLESVLRRFLTAG